MALNKVINDANQKFEPVTTETLVFDTVPTEGSFNAVTSDGVAKAIAEGGSSLEAGDGIAISEGTISAKVDGETIVINADGELESAGGGASYTAGAGISIDNNDTISVNHDSSLADVAGTMPVEINGMSGSFKILPNAALTMDDYLTISSSSSAWASTGIGADQIPGYMRVKLTSASDSSKYVISTINCRKGTDEIYLDTTWSPYGMAGVAFNSYENAPLSYAFNWGALTLADIGLTTGSGTYVTFVMCDSNGNQLGNDLMISGLSATAWSVGSSAAPQQLSVANPVPSTNMVSIGSVLTVGSTFQAEWAAPSGGGGGIDTFLDGLEVTPDKKTIGALCGNTVYVSGRQYNAMLPLTNYSNTDTARIWNPWGYAYNNKIMIYSYTGFNSYNPTWYPIQGNYNIYIRQKTVTEDYKYNDYYIWDGTSKRYVGNHYYSVEVNVPTGSGTTFDESIFDVVGDWSSITTPIQVWFLGFTDSNGNRTSSLMTASNTTTELSIRRGDYALEVKTKTNGGLSVDYYNGLYVTNPVPAFDPTNDEGKVLKIVSGVPTWVTP